MGQTQQGEIGIELGDLEGAGFADLGEAGQGREEREQIGGAHQDQPARTLRRERQVAGELDGVARALLGMDEERLAGDGAAVPARMGAVI
jgi:hypothetical protein